MINLEKHIKEQRLLLDTDHPREGHEKRFMQKLQRHPVRSFSIRHVLQVAASLAIIITSGIVLVKLDKDGNKMAQKEVPEAVREADLYFTSQVNARVDQIRAFSFEDSEEKAVLLNELDDLDAYHHQLMSDLEANPEDGRVINALIRHYQIKLEAMDQIILQLNQIKSETTENYENADI